MSVLDIHKLRFKHFADYINGWFEIYDQKQREKIIYNDDTFEFEFKKPYCHMQNYINKQDYQIQLKKWADIVDHNTNKYLQTLKQMIHFLNKFPQSFQEVYPPPVEFSTAYRTKVVNSPLNKRWKRQLQNLQTISSFKLIKRTSSQWNEIKQLFFSRGDIKHITIKQSNALKVGQLIDFRDKNGKVYIVKIIKKNENETHPRIKIKYYKRNPLIEQWCDCNNDFYNMFPARSVSERPMFKYKQLNIGTRVCINLNGDTQQWNMGVIKELDAISGQIAVAFSGNGSTGENIYWVHSDNSNEFSVPGQTNNRPNRQQTQAKANKKRKRIEEKSESDMDSGSDNEPIVKKRKLELLDVNGKENKHNGVLVKIETFNSNGNNQSEMVTVHNHFISNMNDIPALEAEEVIENVNGMGGRSEMEFYKKECEVLKEEIKLFNGMSDGVNNMNWNELNELEMKLKNGIKCVENAKERLWNRDCKSVYCVMCNDNKRNVCFMDGCNHFVLCMECERNVKVKVCPICKVSYAKIKQLDV